MKKFLKILKAAQAFVRRVLTTVLLVIIYVIAVVPTGLLMRVLGRDRLRLRKTKTDTYWKNADGGKNDYDLQF